MVLRVLLSLMVVPAFAVLNDAVMDRVAGTRHCLDHGLAASSPGLTEALCFTIVDQRSR